MVLVKSNQKYNERKHFLLRAINSKFVEPEKKAEYKKELPILEEKIKKNLLIALKESEEQMRKDIEQAKIEIPDDGNFKRAIAKNIIKLLSNYLKDNEIKGILRQGYKIMRLK